NAGMNADMLQLRDLLNFKIQAQDGSFGRVSDVVFDRNGNIQYVLGSYRGQVFPLPFNATTLSDNTNALKVNVPISSLQQLSIAPTNLPSMQDAQFVAGMRQLFGQSFGTNSPGSGFQPLPSDRSTPPGVVQPDPRLATQPNRGSFQPFPSNRSTPPGVT